MPSPELTDAAARRPVFASCRAPTAQDANTRALPILGGALGTRTAIVDALAFPVDPVGTDRALLDCIRSGAPGAVVAWRAGVSALCEEVDRVFLGRLVIADEARLARDALVDEQVCAFLAVVARHASCAGTCRLPGANIVSTACEGLDCACRAVIAFRTLFLLLAARASTFAVPSRRAQDRQSGASGADRAWRARGCVPIASSFGTEVARGTESAICDV